MSHSILTKRAMLAVAGLCLFGTGAATAKTFEASKISFRDITGNVEIVTTSGDEIGVSIRQGKTYHHVALSEQGGEVLLVGERWQDDKDRNCCDNRISRKVNLRDGRKATTGAALDEGLFAEYPTIVVSMPFKGDVDFVDARITLKMDRLDGALGLDACYVYGEVGDVDEAVIGLVDGSRLVVGNVLAGLEVDVSGDADLLVGDATMVDIDIAGPGDVRLGNIDGMMDISIAGSGVVRSTRVDGPMTVRVAGSGGVAVKAGQVERLRANIDGSGGVYIGGEVTQPDLRLYGSSEVKMKSVNGRITHHGSGIVYVADKRVE